MFFNTAEEKFNKLFFCLLAALPALAVTINKLYKNL
jgi:hypothetical protein